MKPILGQQLIVGHPLNQLLIGDWPMNEGGGNRIQDGISSRNMAISGAVWVAGKENSCLFFDGSNDIARTGNMPFKNNLTNITMSIWLRHYADSIKKQNSFISIAGFNSYKQCMRIMNGGPTYPWSLNYIETNNAGTTKRSYPIGSGYNLADTLWHHVVISRNKAADLLSFYVDGNMVGTDTGLVDMTDSDIYNASVGAFGYSSSSASGYVKADLDMPLIFNQALSSSDILELYINNISRYEECMQ